MFFPLIIGSLMGGGGVSFGLRLLEITDLESDIFGSDYCRKVSFLFIMLYTKASSTLCPVMVLATRIRLTVRAQRGRQGKRRHRELDI